MAKLFHATALMNALLAFSLVPFAVAQSGRGVLTGMIQDQTSGIVPGAEVVIRNQETGVEMSAATTGTGVYRIPYVPAGRYVVTVTVPGFRRAVREDVEVHLTQTVTVDFELEVGEIAETVTVLGGTPLLEKSTSEIGTISTEREVHSWPLMIGEGTRQLQTFIFTSMPGTQGNQWEGSINGGQAFSHEVLIDGITVGRFDINGANTLEFTAAMDAVSEFKLQTGAISAQYGNTQTGLANFGLKSGTNDCHGSAFWFHQNSALNANSWADNNSGRIDPETGKAFKANTRLNNGGFTIGGPILEERAHFFVSYEQHNEANYVTSPEFDASPTAEMKRGDFSRLLDPRFTQNPMSGEVVGQDALGRDVVFGQIYDPLTTRQLSNGIWVRDPFAGNIIPSTRISAVTKKMLNPAYVLPDPSFPLKSQVGETLHRNTIRIGVGAPELKIHNVSVKLDHVVNRRHKISASFIENDRYRYGFGLGYHLPGKIPNTPASGDIKQSTPGQIVRFAEDWTIGPGMLNHFAYGYNRFMNQLVSNASLTGKDWAAELGFHNVAGGADFPCLLFTGPSQLLSGAYKTWGCGGVSTDPNGSNIVADDFTWIKSKHSVRLGFEHRRYYDNNVLRGTPGRYGFNSNTTALPFFNQQTGFGFSSFMLGAANATYNEIIGMTQGVRARSTAIYVQDDWKATNKLTLNLGIRWDIPTSYTNPNNMMSGLDSDKPNPGADGFPGALAFLGSCTACNGKTAWADIYYGQWAPRLGFAYSVNNRLVLRGGYGVNYGAPLLDGWLNGWTWNYWTGFNGINAIAARTGRPGGGNDPAYWWDDPYPAYGASLPNYDPAQMNDFEIYYYSPESRKLPKVQNWNFGIQYQLPWDTRLEANYVGNHGSRLSDAYKFNMNQLDPKYLSLGDALLEDVDLHPEFKKPYPSFYGTVSRSLLPFPQYASVATHRLNSGWSNYSALQVTVTKRTAHGLSFLAAYTFSKALATTDHAMGYGGGQTIYNRKLDYSVTALSIPNAFRLTWIYDLPFGPQGRWLKGGHLSRVLGGWTVSAIQFYQSGKPLSIVNSAGPDTLALNNSGFYVDTLLPRDRQIIGPKPDDPDRNAGSRYLNPEAWGPVPVTEHNVALRLGNGVRYQPNLRGFPSDGEQFSVMKRTRVPLLREGISFEIRADITNLFNRTWISDPETDLGDMGRFGHVFSKYNKGRVIQLGARVSF
jgi:hypothetical protein